MISGFLVPPAGWASLGAPRALIVPHAGYIYSGATAGLGYALVQPLADQVKHVIIVGPAHRVAIRGIALPDADTLETPLGVVPLWADGVRTALAQPDVVVSGAVHAQEHSLEVQLPFLQTVLPAADVLPLAASWVDPAAVAAVLEALWAPDTFVVISSDLSHYHSYAQARRIDEATVRQILRQDPTLDYDQACGATGVNAMALVARAHGLHPHLLGLCNSGDTAGDKSRVVGYAAVAFHECGLHPDHDGGLGEVMT
jgi:AmmeMemoRadiSam system protein B